MAKRGNGEGSIYRRKRDGRWVASVSIAGKRKVHYGDARDEVREWLTVALRSRQQGLLMAGPAQTVEHYLNRWLEESVRTSVRPRTYESYDVNVRRLVPHIGKLRLSTLGPAVIQAAYAALLKRGLSHRSVGQAHAVLHTALRRALLWGLIARNPTEAVLVPRAHRREMRTLTDDQLRLLFEATKSSPLHALWVLLATTGLRLGEALGLTWPDVDFERRSLMVRRALQRLPKRLGGVVLVEPKTDRSRRTVYLARGTMAALAEHRRRQAEERLAASERFVFTGTTGRPLDASGVSARFHDALNRAGLPNVRVHDLRHTAASHLLTRGVHPKVVQDLLGHSTISLTLDTYSHVAPALNAQVADHMQVLFSKNRSVV
jgi:integrase